MALRRPDQLTSARQPPSEAPTNSLVGTAGTSASTRRGVELNQNSPNLEDRIRRLEDAEEIRCLWHRYLLLFDRGGAHQDIAELFTEDAVFETRGADGPDRFLRGRNSIVNDFLRIVSPPRPLKDDRVYSGHQGTLCEMEIHRDSARLLGRFLEMTGRGPGTMLAVGGTHSLDLRREALGWRVAGLVMQLTFCVQLDTVDPRTAFLGKPPSE
ncbi:nuclear transport factor 2 family protein [Nocardioides alcanivorans]|uniref:nuclear transport factor 2 family protein n=1 Tax=Nocardioides alcanivorans TaxID=2897352 RepID=UPI0035E15449